MTSAKWTQPDSTTQDATTFKNALESAALIHQQIAGAFNVRASDTPGLSVVIEAGVIFAGGTNLIEKAQQSISSITAPVTNPRKDLIEMDPLTGTAYRIAGTEAASPALPAVTAGRVPLAYYQIATGATAITNAIIVPVRSPFWGGLMRLGNQTIIGDSFALNPHTTPTSNTGIELGNTGGQATSTYIDFHSGAVATDFDVRLITTGGTGVSGGAVLDVVADKIKINNNTVWHDGNRPVPAAGYSATGRTFIAITSASSSYTSLALGVNTNVPAPAGATHLKLRLINTATSANSVLGRYSQTRVFSDEFTTMYMTPATASAYEQVAIPVANMLSIASLIVDAPVIGGNAKIRFATRDDGGNSHAEYEILGYYV